MANLIPKVNDQNEVVGETTITIAKENGWYRRVTRIFLLSSDGASVLLQKRAATVTAAPGCWDMCGGHVDVGETFLEAGAREVDEELGISVVPLAVTEPIKGSDTFTVICTATISKTTHFTLDHSEVSEVRWVALDELDKEMKLSDTFTPWIEESWYLLRDTLLTT